MFRASWALWTTAMASGGFDGSSHSSQELAKCSERSRGSCAGRLATENRFCKCRILSGLGSAESWNHRIIDSWNNKIWVVISEGFKNILRTAIFLETSQLLAAAKRELAKRGKPSFQSFIIHFAMSHSRGSQRLRVIAKTYLNNNYRGLNARLVELTKGTYQPALVPAMDLLSFSGAA